VKNLSLRILGVVLIAVSIMWGRSQPDWAPGDPPSDTEMSAEDQDNYRDMCEDSPSDAACEAPADIEGGALGVVLLFGTGAFLVFRKGKQTT
jgi:hypothetical protein